MADHTTVPVTCSGCSYVADDLEDAERHSRALGTSHQPVIGTDE